MLSSLQHLFTPWPLTLMLLGTSLGIIVGAIPGLTGAMVIALALPLTYQMDYPGAGLDAMILLVSMYVGSISGGLISATLLRIPGTPASMVTTLDGYPLAAGGRPGKALGLGISSSLVGGMISWLFLLLLAKPMAIWSTKLGHFDFFAMVLMALALISTVSGKSILRGLLSGALGILATMPGTSRATGEVRWTLGISELNAGFQLLPVLIGLFAISQIIQDVRRMHEPRQMVSLDSERIRLSLADWWQHSFNLVRSSVIGTWIGILPGIGANIGSLVAYSAAKGMSRNPAQFGKGSEEGIVASEAANNATVGGALIPLVSMGIPGSVIDAILLGALVVHGLQPGPLLFKTDPDVVYTIIVTVFFANLVMFGFMVASIRWLARLMVVPKQYLIPLILAFCIIGSYALNNRTFDVWVMLAFGLLGYVMERAAVPLAPFVIGFVLAPVAEESLAAGLMRHGGSYWPLIQSPIACGFTIVAVGLLIWPFYKRLGAWLGWRPSGPC